MAKKRIIFVLHVQRGKYMLSRNFSLQGAGDLAWLKKHYSFEAIASAVDELIVLNVDRGPKDMDVFAQSIEELTRNCFMPLSVGGGIRSLDAAYRLMSVGADKLVVNTALFADPELVTRLVGVFGSQCVIASLDFKSGNDVCMVWSENGSKCTGLSLHQAVEKAVALGVGELMLNSIKRDGTGQGLELEVLKQVTESVPIPVIASGGVGTYQHLVEGIQCAHAEAVATANLFNFMGDGLSEARAYVTEQGISLATWDNSFLKEMGYK